MLGVAVEEGGDKAVDDLFSTPPTTDEHQLDPWTLIADHAVPIPVDEPELERRRRSSTTARSVQLGWLLLLSERIPVEQALTAADGWGGDAYVAYDKSGSQLRADRLPSATPPRRHADEGALRRLGGQSAQEPGQRVVERLPAAVRVVRPGTQGQASVATQSSAGGRRARAEPHVPLGDRSPSPGSPIPQARCSSDLLVRRLTVKQLNDPKVDPALVRRIIAPCLAPADLGSAA